MISTRLRARLDRARRADDPNRTLVAEARRGLLGDLGQFATYRRLVAYQAGLDFKDLDSVADGIDLAWGAPWAVGPPVFDRPLVETATAEAGSSTRSVAEVIRRIGRWDGRAVRVEGVWSFGEVGAFRDISEADRARRNRPALAVRSDLDRWLRLREHLGRSIPGTPPLGDARAVASWLRETVADRTIRAIGVVERKDRGHLACRSGGIFLLGLDLDPSD